MGLRSYEVLALLGEGYEGIVWLVRDGVDLKVVKKYNDRFGHYGLLRNMRRMRKLESAGVRVLHRFGTDIFHRTALLEYVEGIPVGFLLKPEYATALTPQQRELIRARYREFYEKSRKLSAKAPYLDDETENVLLDLRTGEFVIIDPQ